MKRFTVSQAKDVEGRDKPIWLRHGIAFQKDDKPVRIKLESLPVANKDGEIWLTLFEETGERSQGYGGRVLRLRGMTSLRLRVISMTMFLGELDG